MILDNAPWHKKAKRLIRDEKLPEYQDIHDAVEFLDIPPYSPDLNPIEQLWRITRKDVTHNRYFASLDLLSAALTSFFNRFKEANAKIASLCTFKFIDSEHSTSKKHVAIGSGYITLPNSTDLVIHCCLPMRIYFGVYYTYSSRLNYAFTPVLLELGISPR